MALDPAFCARLRELGGADTLFAPGDCWPYGFDNSGLHAPPDAVAFARDHRQVADIVRLCNEHRVPLTARGRGTATTGAAVPVNGGLALSFERMAALGALDAGSRTLRAEPGATNREIDDFCAPHGLFWPPDPGSAEVCTLGGNLACNAAGPRSVKYGTTRENTLALRAVTGAGEEIYTGAQTAKHAVGFDLTRLLIGSEGALAVITEAVLKLAPLPESRRVMRARYASVEAAADAVVAIMAQHITPSALEIMDETSVALARARAGLDAETRALLIIEADGAKSALDAAADALARASANAGRIGFEQARDAADAEALWAARRALSPALREVAPGKINEDLVVPVSRLGAFIREIEALGARHATRVACFGHAGDGNLHVNLLFDPADRDAADAARRCLSELFDLTLRQGGSLSGEHGVGLTKRDFVAREITPATLELMRRVARVFDPRGVLNPGKCLPEAAHSGRSSTS